MRVRAVTSMVSSSGEIKSASSSPLRSDIIAGAIAGIAAVGNSGWGSPVEGHASSPCDLRAKILASKLLVATSTLVSKFAILFPTLVVILLPREVIFARRDSPVASSSLVLESSVPSRVVSFASRSGERHLVMWPWLFHMSDCIPFMRLLIGERCISIADFRASSTADTIAAFIAGLTSLGGSAVGAMSMVSTMALPVGASSTPDVTASVVSATAVLTPAG